MLRPEGDVEADEEQPEVHLGQAFPELPAHELREPVVDAAEQAEGGRAEQHVVHVGDDEVGVVDVEVEGRGGQHRPGQAADEEDDQEPDAEQHG